MDKKYQEVEMKFRLHNIHEVEDRLAVLRADPVVSGEYQKDIYFAPCHRDFFAEDIISEWLRFRETPEKKQLNYKRWLPLGAAVQTHCEEYETDISDGKAMRAILRYLDFQEIIRVEKVRNTWKYKNIYVCLDTVTDLGTFIEMEYAEEVTEDAIPEISARMEYVLKFELCASVEPRDRRGYPYQMLALRGLL